MQNNSGMNKASDEDLRINQTDKSTDPSKQNIQNSNNNNNNINNTQNTNPGNQQTKEKNTVQPAKPSAPHIDGLMMKDGKVMMVKNGTYMGMNQTSMTLKNGTKVMIDGTIIKNDGSKMKLKEGEEIKMSGEIVSADNSKANMKEPVKQNTKETKKDKNMYLVPDSTIKK
jgi:hypothetical protein